METIKFDFAAEGRPFKPLNATNGGPWCKRHNNSQKRSNFDDYKAARFPYTRNHDSSMNGVYGGPYSHDISSIFPNFYADENDPASYDFACTDESILCALDAGTQTFFRLGQSIEHQIKKHFVYPPKDFSKWARICEHIIRHYNEGWADGFTLGIEYWEIWNEPDLHPEADPMNETWTGTPEQYFELYDITAKHLKKCFPNIKVGGPALAWRDPFAEDFIKKVREMNSPLDFFSWHVYAKQPSEIVKRGERYRKLLDENGFADTESILNEYNYIAGWKDEFTRSLITIHGAKGAAFIASCICLAQSSSIDMLMYYDTRQSPFNGCFDYYTYVPLPTYYIMKWYGMFYGGYREMPLVSAPENVYALCGKDESGKLLSIVAYFDDAESAPDKDVGIDFGKNGTYEVYLLDDTHMGELTHSTSNTEFALKQNTCLLLREV